MRNLLSLDPKIHGLRADSKKARRLTNSQRVFGVIEWTTPDGAGDGRCVGGVRPLVGEYLQCILLSGPGASSSRPMPDGQRQEPDAWNRVVLTVTDLPSCIAALNSGALWQDVPPRAAAIVRGSRGRR